MIVPLGLYAVLVHSLSPRGEREVVGKTVVIARDRVAAKRLALNDLWRQEHVDARLTPIFEVELVE